MKRLAKEIGLIIFIAIIFIALFQFPVNATNDKINIVKTSEEYLIYNEDVMKTNFKFAFANDPNANIASLNLINAKQDSEGNYVAYVDETLQSTYFGEEKSTYIWMLNDANEVIGAEAVEVELNKAITQDIIDFVKKTTDRINVSTGTEEPVVKTEGNTTTTTVVGFLQINGVKNDAGEVDSEDYTYTYQLVKLPNNEQYKRFVELAKEISAFSDNANSYSNIMKINEFYNLYNTLMPTTWKNEVKNNKINEPEDSRHGEQYVVWIKATNGEQEVVDVQFMTCAREETEERSTEIVKEEVTTTTKLPLTFDATMTLIVVLGVIIVAIVILLVIKKKTSNKSK